MKKYGVDVSRHQGNIDWNAVKASGKVDFAILRAGYGKIISQKDARFEQNYAACQKQQIPVGAYWYSYAMTPEEAREEAAVFLQVLKGKQFAYPVYFDLEETKQIAMGKAACSAIAQSFLEAVEKAGYFTGLYMSKSPLERVVTENIRNRYAVWVAHYGVSQTDYAGNFGMWQKSDTGTVNGIVGNVDLDECYQDYPAIIRHAGLNGFTKSVENAQTQKKETMEVTAIKDGKSYSGTLTEFID